MTYTAGKSILLVVVMTNDKKTTKRRYKKMCMYGYCRISQKKQSIDRQIRNIKDAYPQAVIIEEAYTGTTIDRKEWNKLFSKVKEGDTIIFDSVSRMSRNAEEGFTAYEALYKRGVNLIFLKEHHIDTDTYKKTASGLIELTNTNIDFILDGINKYLLALAKEQIKIAFNQAEKEVADLHQRTKEGLETARLNGKIIGKQKGDSWETKKGKTAKEIIKKHSKDFGGTLADSEVMTLAGVSRKTYYKYKKELRGE